VISVALAPLCTGFGDIFVSRDQTVGSLPPASKVRGIFYGQALYADAGTYDSITLTSMTPDAEIGVNTYPSTVVGFSGDKLHDHVYSVIRGLTFTSLGTAVTTPSADQLTTAIQDGIENRLQWDVGEALTGGESGGQVDGHVIKGDPDYPITYTVGAPGNSQSFSDRHNPPCYDPDADLVPITSNFYIE
jgi:hypothetical protein